MLTLIIYNWIIIWGRSKLCQFCIAFYSLDICYPPILLSNVAGSSSQYANVTNCFSWYHRYMVIIAHLACSAQVPRCESLGDVSPSCLNGELFHISMPCDRFWLNASSYTIPLSQLEGLISLIRVLITFLPKTGLMQTAQLLCSYRSSITQVSYVMLIDYTMFFLWEYINNKCDVKVLK